MQHAPGLSSENVQRFADLVEDIAGKPLTRRPYLAPLLLFSAPEVQEQLNLPRPTTDGILIHDYQSITRPDDLKLDGLVPVSAATERKGPTTEIRVTLGTTVLASALRLVPIASVANLGPTRFQNLDDLADLGALGPISCTQDHVGDYVALSGDRNPIHTDAAEAAALGLPAPIVPGVLLSSLIQPICPDAPLETLRVRFMAPLCVDEHFGLALQARGPNRARAYVHKLDGQALAIADLAFLG